MSVRPDNRGWRAVIDVGSNSVRLVIYDVAGQAMLPHYNEKVMASLGANLGKTGKLSPKGVNVALNALGRYRAILDGLEVDHVQCVATAAVRTASDGQAFVDRVELETGLSIDIISGAEEARLSALGLTGGLHEVSGVMGDLGGSSLEFCRIDKGRVLEGESHMLGPLAMDLKSHSIDEIQSQVRKVLKTSKLLSGKGERFYMIGGAWRALAKVHIAIEEYPLHQLHAYCISGQDISELSKAIHRADPLSRQRLLKVGERRAKVLPYASIVLDEVFKMGKFSEAVVSSYGLREGVILDTFGASGHASDTLLDGVALSARLEAPRRIFGDALTEWLIPVMQSGPDLFGEIDADARLVAAACLLADSGARFHPDTRARLAYDQALHGPHGCVTHSERAFIALAVGHRYSRQFKPRAKYERLLSKRATRRAQTLGAAMRLGAVFSGRSARLLENSRIRRNQDKLVLSVKPSDRAMVSMIVERRLQTVADLLDLEPVVTFE